jgi:hypothetical protein
MTPISPTLGILYRNSSAHLYSTHQNNTLLLFWQCSSLRIFCFHVLILHSTCLLCCNIRPSSDNSNKVFSASWTTHHNTFFTLVMHFVLWHNVWVLLQLCWCISGFSHCNCFDLSIFTAHANFRVASFMIAHFGPRWLMFLLVLLPSFLFFH